jgi:hypothetical protein
MDTFKIKGNPFKFKFWKWINNISNDRMKKYQDITIDTTNVIFPTPFTMIIKFTVVNTGKKYELVNQGKFAEYYKSQADGNLRDLNIDTIITELFKSAYEIN